MDIQILIEISKPENKMVVIASMGYHEIKWNKKVKWVGVLKKIAKHYDIKHNNALQRTAQSVAVFAYAKNLAPLGSR